MFLTPLRFKQVLFLNLDIKKDKDADVHHETVNTFAVVGAIIARCEYFVNRFENTFVSHRAFFKKI